MKHEKDIVARQYNEWVYPRPIADMAEWVAQGNVDFADPSLFGWRYWPRRADFHELNILIAGCGTNQAAYFAYRNPGCFVTGIDVSENSLAHQKYLKEKHGLNNLRLALMDLEDVDKLSQDYDQIVSVGVLHHLPDPDQGLQSLRRVLKPDGVMCLMLYGSSLRVGVYMLQEAFRILGLGQTRADVELVKATLEALPPDHSVRAYLTDPPEDLATDAGIVDTFLHPVDRAYSVPQALEFVRRNGLQFMDWQDPMLYSLAATMRPGDPLFEKASRLPPEQQWHVCDLLTQSKGTHSFIACRAERPEADYKPGFEGDAFLRYVPHLTPGLHVVRQSDLGTRSNAVFKRRGQEFEVSYEGTLLLSKSDGKATVAGMLAAVRNFGDAHAPAIERARDFFRPMHEYGHVMMQIPD